MFVRDSIPVILLAFANSAANPLPSLAEEYRRLEKTLRAAQERGYCELVTAPYATVDDILDAFQNERTRGRIAVLHYAGHADDFQLFLEGAGGKGVVADAGGLAAFLGQQKGLQLVFLNACSTRAQVQGLLDAGVAVVVATDQAIDDGVATELSGRFYQYLADGDSVRVAYDKAAGAVRFARGSETRGLYLVGARDKPEAAHWPWALYERPEAPDAAGWNLFAAAVRERLPYEPETVLIPAGPFLMGSVAGEGVPAIETPQHEVLLPPYRMGRYPVTKAQYRAYAQEGGVGVAPEAGWVLAAVGQVPAPGLEEHPMVGVSWDEAAAYCRWLAETTGRGYRLPSEAEWEKGARGGDGRLYPWGNEFAPDRCNAAAGLGRTTAVGAYSPQGDSPYGLADMAGNVWEWTSTLWGRETSTAEYPYPYRADDGRERSEPPGGPYREVRIARGGSYRDPPGRATCAARARAGADARSPTRGFRVALDVSAR